MNKLALHRLLLNMAVFEEVAESGSYSVAAKNLNMTPSTVSKRISQLEESLETRLIERTTRTMRLTDTGDKILGFCKNMIHEAHSAAEVASQVHDKIEGSLSIGVPRAFANQVLRPIVKAFLNQYPDIKLQVIVTDSSLDLLRENIDCAIEITSTPSEYVVAKPLRLVRQILCATPTYLTLNPNPIQHPNDLMKHQCIYLGESNNDNQWKFVQLSNKSVEPSNLEAITVSVNGRYVVNHAGMRLDGVLNDFGIGCLPDFIAEKYLSSGKIVEVLPDWQLKSKYEGKAWITYLPNKFQPLRLKTFVNFVMDSLV